MQAKVEVIRKLDIYQPTMDDLGGYEAISTDKYKELRLQYFKSPHDDFVTNQSLHFPVVLLKDGTPWSDANRFLLHKAKGINPAKHRTLDSIARDLVSFRRWIDEENINYMLFPKRVMARPTYQYCSYLHDEIRNKKIAIGTAKRRMSSIQGFYRWMKLTGTVFEHPLWREGDAYILFKDRHGFSQSKNITTTDLTKSFKHTKNTNNYSEYIDDGGKLRPLPKDEQYALVNALKSISNIEMMLSFLIALTTGARLQTVFTLRKQNFEMHLPDSSAYRRIKVGNGTLVDTKFGKQMVILIPSWLYRRVQLYLACERYNTRNRRSPHIYKEQSEQYIFLTRAGKPYYMANNDPYASIYRIPPRGNAITQFIRQQLKPLLTRSETIFEIRFHDLRATFGMNLLEEKTNESVPALHGDINKPDYFSILMHVRERMGHSNITTTEKYLNYRKNFKIAIQVQSEYEIYLENLLQE